MARSRYHLRTLRSAMEGESRTLCGQEYIVISVVALVEGVRHAGGSPTPELVLAEAFGRHVETWNGRPIVVNHPVDDKGQAVLASRPDVLENSYLGRMMSSRVENGKLITDAYLEIAAIQASESKRVQSMWKRLTDGETVEVSVGAIVYTKKESGEYNGKKYSGSWDVVIPDHLAFLDGGQTGACSVEDGCGTFRTHSVGVVKLSEGARRNMARLAANTGGNPSVKTVKSAVNEPATHREACDCGGKKGLIAGQPEEQHIATGTAVARILWNAETFDHDRRGAMQRALGEKFGPTKMCYVVAFNDECVVYEEYNGERFILLELEYSSDAKNVITFSGEPTEVVLQTKSVPVPVSSNSKKSEESLMSSKALQSLAAKAKSKADKEDEEDGGIDEEAENADGSLKKGGKKKMSSASYPTHIIALAESLDSAETLEDIAKALEGTVPGKKLLAAMKVCASARQQAVKVIQASKSGKNFSDAMLAAMEFDALSQLAVTFLSADKKAAEKAKARAAAEEDGSDIEDIEDEDLEGSEEEDTDESDDSEETEEEDASVAALNAIMDFDGKAERLNGAVAKKKALAQNQASRPGMTARLAAPGRATYGGRAAQGGSTSRGVPTPPDIFPFDENNQYIQPKAKT